MRSGAWFAAILALAAAAACAPAPPPPPPLDPPSLLLARERVEACRNAEHRAKMIVRWTDVPDEVPPDGTEVVMVRGYMSYEVSRMVLRGERVEAGSVRAVQSWFLNRGGEGFGADTFEVPRDRFLAAWNAMRRILAASDERVVPLPENGDSDSIVVWTSHESVDWTRAVRDGSAVPLHRADRPGRRFAPDQVIEWDSLRDQAIFETFQALLPPDGDVPSPGTHEVWAPFLSAELRAATQRLDLSRLRRDGELLETCLRVLGEVGDEGAEADVAGFSAALDALDAPDSWVKSARADVVRAATRLRLRLHWSRGEVERTLRTLPRGTWSDEDQSKWLRATFRAKDPDGWAEFLVAETTRADASSDDLAEAAGGMRDLPAERAVPLLHALLERDDPYARLEAALALHDVAPADPLAAAGVVALALDRSIACDWRPDLVDRWSRSRALVAALEWGGLEPAALRAHLLAPERERPEFLEQASSRIAQTPDALGTVEAGAAWGRILDEAPAPDVQAAVRHLVSARDVASKARMVAALDRVAGEEGVDRTRLDGLREEVDALTPPADPAR